MMVIYVDRVKQHLYSKCLFHITSGCTASVQIFRREPTAIIGQNYTLTCDVIQWGSECNIEAYFIYHKNKLKSTSNTLTFTPFNLSDANGSNYVCIATVNGFNFTSNPTYLPSILAAQCKNNYSWSLPSNHF